MSLNIELLYKSVIGDQYPIRTPFGVKPLIYTDYTASGRSIDFIEDFIQTKVLPFYSNTHFDTSLIGRQISLLRQQNRSIIRQPVNATRIHHTFQQLKHRQRH
ncbi:MAG: hypothetical protein HRU23_17445 [Gammaproteobacteria bacterium]|nr:hypothetical protein [Gammaproteobacteria bacterium]